MRLLHRVAHSRSAESRYNARHAELMAVVRMADETNDCPAGIRKR